MWHVLGFVFQRFNEAALPTKATRGVHLQPGTKDCTILRWCFLTLMNSHELFVPARRCARRFGSSHNGCKSGNLPLSENRAIAKAKVGMNT